MNPPAKRQRVLRACDECKRKKKQCSGSQPCTTCLSKSRVCSFSTAPPLTPGPQRDPTEYHQKARRNIEDSELRQASRRNGAREYTDIPSPKDPPPDDETPIENPGRLLQDGGGRMLYLGDSATLSFLQSVRRLVASHLGRSSFTTDSNRHKILEVATSVSPSYQHNYSLPDLETAQYLINSAFESITGLFEIFNKSTFVSKVLETYREPLDADPQWLCHLNLIFAIGLLLRRDVVLPSPSEIELLQRLEGKCMKRAEVFYATAKHLKDPVIAIEEGGIEVVQSLFLMVIYFLASAKRNSAWMHLGMAVNLAFALGVHKEETLSVFNSSEQRARRNLWQSLYIMDCFLAASLGRPNSISSISASDLCPFPPPSASSPGATVQENSLVFTVNASKIIGNILSRVYHKRKASRSIAYFLSLRLSEWKKELPEELHWRRISDPNEPQDLTLKRLHINLIYFHGILLLTRPFLLHQIAIKLEGSTTDLSPTTQGQVPKANRPEQMFCFHGACVRSAMHTITAVYAAYNTSTLPRRDPFVVYWLFSAALIILANTFCPVHAEPDSEAAIQKALAVMSFCGTKDPQARRYQTILEDFHEVLTAEAKKKSKEQETQSREGQSIFNVLFGDELAQSSCFNNVGNGNTDQTPRSQAGGAGDGKPNDAQNSARIGQEFSNTYNGLCSAEYPAWLEGLPTVSGEALDFDGAWWAGDQDNFISTGDGEVPLYGLMEPI
ncbi:fungal-specific transcription factor domain-containing protein [Halenospora varia]|nr:fungal-specific transcription factor domain-containing protein [Halenospora varia]